jgi:hypothetical protein
MPFVVRVHHDFLFFCLPFTYLCYSPACLKLRLGDFCSVRKLGKGIKQKGASIQKIILLKNKKSVV